MPYTLTSMRLDNQSKEEAKQILSDLGLNISSATNMFLKAVVREKGLPFKVKLSNTTPNFTDEYIAPLISERNRIKKTNASASRTKKIIELYKAETNINRHKVVI